MKLYSGIPELRSLGLKRLTGFGATVGGIPYGMVETFKAKNDVTERRNASFKKNLFLNGLKTLHYYLQVEMKMVI